MRKPRDFDAELKALTEKAKLLKERKVMQLGELVIATGADALDPEMLTGALLVIVETKDSARKDSWRNRGVTFFQNAARKPGRGARSNHLGSAQNEGSTQPTGNDAGAQ